MVAPKIDGFEDTDFSGWAGSTSNQSQSTSTVKNGSGSMELQINNGNNFTVYKETGSAVEVDYLQFYIYMGAATNADDHRVYYKEGGNAGTTIFDFRFNRASTTGGDLNFNGVDNALPDDSFTTNTWYFMEVLNIDWVNETCELYRDGTQVNGPNADDTFDFMNSSTNGIDALEIGLFSPNTFNSHWDDMAMPAVAGPSFDSRSSIDDGTETWNATQNLSGISERGFVYDTTSYSSPGDTSPANSNYTSVVNETGSFSSGSFSLSPSGLSNGTTYYVRSYTYDGSTYQYSSEASLSAGEISRTESTQSDFDAGTFNNTIATADDRVELIKNSYTESFESGFGSWVNGGDIETSSDTWTRNSGGTTSSGTGPSSAYDGSYYVYVESSNGEGAYNSGDETIMEYDLGGTTDGDVNFWCHMDGADQGTLYLEGYDGSTWNEIWSISGDQGASWFEVTSSETSFTGYSDLRFRRVAAGGWEADTSLDLITVNKGSQSTYPTSGTYTGATFDVSKLADASSSTIDWTETLNGQSITVETRYSTDGGVSWSSWTQVSDGGSGQVSGIGSSTSNALVQYRANLSGDGSSTPVFEQNTFTVKAYGGDQPGYIRQTKSGAVVQTKSVTNGIVQKTNT